MIDPKTNGPVCDAEIMTSVEGVFSCGNALHVNDLVDYVSKAESLRHSPQNSGAKQGIIDIMAARVCSACSQRLI